MIKIKPLVSVIIPVYNAEKYIKKCLKSVINQTLKEIEIIVVNDGSKDNSLKLITELATVDNRIKIVNQQNSGVSATRNNGISLAGGDYIGFVDADDFIEPEMFENMVLKAKDFNADIVVCNVNDIFKNKTRTSLQLSEGIIEIEDITKEQFLTNQYFKLGTAVWHKLFKKELIIDNDINFIDYKEVSSEDTVFNFQCMVKAQRIYCLDENLYNYVIREDSLTKSKVSKINMVYRCKNTVEILYKYCSENSIDVGEFIEYINYFEFINALSYVNPITPKNLVNAIYEYSDSIFFKQTLKALVFSNELDLYFKNHKNGYSIIYKFFDKAFGFLCYINLYKLASWVHVFRVKRKEIIQSKGV